MDPNTCLEEIRALVVQINAAKQGDDAASLAEKFDALDEWICKGGFLPREWEEASE